MSFLQQHIIDPKTNGFYLLCRNFLLVIFLLVFGYCCCFSNRISKTKYMKTLFEVVRKRNKKNNNNKQTGKEIAEIFFIIWLFFLFNLLIFVGRERERETPMVQESHKINISNLETLLFWLFFFLLMMSFIIFLKQNGW